jgi:hypothetical protein
VADDVCPTGGVGRVAVAGVAGRADVQELSPGHRANAELRQVSAPAHSAAFRIVHVAENGQRLPVAGLQPKEPREGLIRGSVQFSRLACSLIALITSGRPGMPLLAREDSLLVVVDLQPGFWGDFLGADDQRYAREVAARAAWLAGVASAVGIPAVITEEDPEHNGPTDAAVFAALRPSAPVFTKPVFGLADCPDIMEAISATGRHTAVLAGYETDVCVTHSAIGLQEAGYHVVVVADAVYAPFGAQAPGIARLRDLGVGLVHCKGVYYDWMRTLKAARAFTSDNPQLAEPPGFSL